MNVPTFLARIALAGATVSVTTSAFATIVVDTFTGGIIAPQEYTSIIQDTDPLNLFGGGSLVGDRFKAVVTTDTSLAVAAFSTVAPGVYDLNGGSIYGGAPFNSVVLTLYSPRGGVLGSVSLSGTYLGRAGYFNAAITGYNVSTIGSAVAVQTSSISEIFSAGAPITPADLADFPASFTSEAGYSSNDMGSYFYLQSAGGTTGMSLGTTCFTSGSGSCPSPPPPPAPEPATWALMLVGVTSVGGALRRRRLRAA